MSLTTPPVPTRTNADVAAIDSLRRQIKRMDGASVQAQFALNEAQLFLAQFVTCPEPRFAEKSKQIADQCHTAIEELRTNKETG